MQDVVISGGWFRQLTAGLLFSVPAGSFSLLDVVLIRAPTEPIEAWHAHARAWRTDGSQIDVLLSFPVKQLRSGWL